MIPIDFKIEPSCVDYEEALLWMEKRVTALQNHEAPECIWLLEHPPLYTLGTSAKDTDVLPSARLPVFKTGRGGQVTYHGPGQRVVYLTLDLKERNPDIKWYVATLEDWIIQVLAEFGIPGERRPGRVGIWVQKQGHDFKIAALGVRLQKWVTSHGFAINVHPDLSAYRDIVPCGLPQYGITSFADLGVTASLKDVDDVLRKTCPF